MKIHFNGADQTVTGSQHLLEVNGRFLLLDCGMYQGKRQATYDRNRNFPFDPAKLDSVILSHAHIDHSGNLPNLVKKGFNKSIYTTPTTARLADVMLQDSGHIQEADAEFMNKKHYRHGETTIVDPLYTLEDAKQVAQYFSGQPYKQTFEPIPGVKATLYDAGHILGSAAVCLDIDENGRQLRFWYSGDIGRYNLPLLQDPTMPLDVDYLMMECTYGDTPHGDPAQAYYDFRDVLKRTIARHGKLIVPSFAVGRTQEIVYSVNKMISDGEIPAIPVYVDSPLALAATKVFQEFPDLFDEETRKFIQEERHPALNFPTLHYIESVDESKALNDMHEPMLILAASGMAETGRILHHLKNNIENPINTIAIVSWQAPDTLGRRLADGDKEVKIFGEWYRVNAEVAVVHGFSAHAGQELLLQYAETCKDRQKQIFLVHSEDKPETAFQQLLAQNGITNVRYPALGEAAEI